MLSKTRSAARDLIVKQGAKVFPGLPEIGIHHGNDFELLKLLLELGKAQDLPRMSRGSATPVASMSRRRG